MSRTCTDIVRLALSGSAMGSRWTAVVHAPRGAADAAGLAAELAGAVAAVERQMSGWRADSDLSRLNAAPVGVWVDLPDDLAHVLDAALRIGRATDCAFDIGVGAAAASWGFGPDAAASPGPLAALGPRAVAALDLDAPGRRARKRAAVTLDLSAIAKGFGVDALARALDARGLDSYLVGVDGELRARGAKPDGTPFAVAVERPQVGLRAVWGVVTLRDCAVATSGDYRRWRDARGARVSHTIDPAAGAPVAHALASVTTLAPTAMEADAFATALMTLGPERGPDLARRLGLDALFLVRAADGLSERGVGLFAAA